MTQFVQKDEGSAFDNAVDIDMGYQKKEALKPALEDVVVALLEKDVPRRAIDEVIQVAVEIVEARRGQNAATHT